jgi:hypothetical protein
MSDDPNESNLAGQFGQAMPVGGDQNAYEAGRGIKAWNDTELARQNTPIAVPDFPVGGQAPASSGTSYPIGGGGGVPLTGSGNPLSGIVGFVLLIFVGAPYYYLSVPLWMSLYPAAASITVAVYVAVFTGIANDATFTGSGHVAASAIIAFIVAWPATLGDQILARRYRGYWIVRHWVRLALIGLWAVYALSLHGAFTAQMPSANPQLPPLQWTPTNIALAFCAVVVMHVFLSKKLVLGSIWSRVRGRG